MPRFTHPAMRAHLPCTMFRRPRQAGGIALAMIATLLVVAATTLAIRMARQVEDRKERVTQTQVRSALAVFLFKGDDVFKPVRALSGGEKAKVLLLKLMLSKANFLLLDEPTNHLDIASREALESALQGYEGTLFVISHDRYLINKIADRVYYLEPGGAEEYQGNYDAFLEKRRQEDRIHQLAYFDELIDELADALR